MYLFRQYYGARVICSGTILALMTFFGAKSSAGERSLKILNYVAENGSSSDLVMIEGGRDRGVVDDGIFEARREIESNGVSGSQKIWIETGRLKAVRVEEHFTLAAVTAEESQLSRAFFPKFPGVMAGDSVQEIQVVIGRNPAVLPVRSATFATLFDDPKALPATFELSQEGKQRIKEMASIFSDVRLPLLLVEAYTDHNGPAEANQVESYQRALTVRQFIIDELGFDAARIVAVGFGESEQIGQDFVPGYREENRRVVIKLRDLARKSSP